MDMGSNALRLLVADCNNGRITPVYRQREVVRLAQGMKAGLAAASKKRARGAVEALCAKAGELGAQTIIMVATHACRKAVDGRVFVAGLKKEFNLDQAVVLSSKEESRLAAQGVARLLAGNSGNAWVLDIGAGSTELAPLLFPDSKGIYLPFGSLNLKERFIHSDPPRAGELMRIRNYLNISVPEWPRVGRLVASSGTASIVAALDLGLTKYDPDKINNHIIRRARLQSLLARFAGLTKEEIIALPGMEPGRADILVGGLVLLQSIVTALKLSQVTIMDAGLLEGSLLAFINNCKEIFNYEPGTLGLDI